MWCPCNCRERLTRAIGVAPSADWTLTSAPAFSTRFTTSMLLLAHAKCSTLRPSLLLIDTMSLTCCLLVAVSRRQSTMLRLLGTALAAAAKRAVRVSAAGMFGSAPACMRLCTQKKWLLVTATKSGVWPLLFCWLMLPPAFSSMVRQLWCPAHPNRFSNYVQATMHELICAVHRKEVFTHVAGKLCRNPLTVRRNGQYRYLKKRNMKQNVKWRHHA